MRVPSRLGATTADVLMLVNEEVASVGRLSFQVARLGDDPMTTINKIAHTSDVYRRGKIVATDLSAMTPSRTQRMMATWCEVKNYRLDWFDGLLALAALIVAVAYGWYVGDYIIGVPRALLIQAFGYMAFNWFELF